VTLLFQRAGARAAWMAIAGLLCLAGCEGPKRPTASATRVFAVDQTGAAKVCTVPQPTLKDSEVATIAVSVGNDGGWCGITIERGGKPFDAGLLTDRPEHGRVFIHSVGDTTRIDYTPDRRFAGADSFTVTLLPGNAAIHANVTVAAP
jgi:hypothetical protein